MGHHVVIVVAYTRAGFLDHYTGRWDHRTPAISTLASGWGHPPTLFRLFDADDPSL